jgi:hypothetical protein
MGSDRARETYDPTRQYRRVVAQQGRVELEADKNEADRIQMEQSRLAVMDAIGPFAVMYGPGVNAANASTPSAFQIVFPPPMPAPNPPPFDFAIGYGAGTGPGTGALYLSGWRIESEPGQYDQSSPPNLLSMTYSLQSQADWVDIPANPTNNPGVEAIYLHVIEQEVSTVEDSVLREVALGGPDTAQRVRLTRHVERFGPAPAGMSCANLVSTVLSQVYPGKTFDPSTNSLVSNATLQVVPESGSGTTTGGPGTNGNCEPAAQGGYLGAENQLIRVQIAEDGSHFLWAYDDASDLYRVDVASSNDTTTTLRLRTVPVDALHQPISGQYVEVLGAAVQLDKHDNYIACTSGFLTTLAADYTTDASGAGIVSVNAPIPSIFPQAQPPAIFLRVWQYAQAIQAGSAVALLDRDGKTGIGIQILLNDTTDSPPKFWPGDFWIFAVRPNTPTLVYPQRYIDSGQPPEGPRQWIAPLAVINWGPPPNVVDCRKPYFVFNLVELTNLLGAVPGMQTTFATASNVTMKPGSNTTLVTTGSLIVAAGQRAILRAAVQVTVKVTSNTSPVAAGPIGPPSFNSAYVFCTIVNDSGLSIAQASQTVTLPKLQTGVQEDDTYVSVGLIGQDGAPGGTYSVQATYSRDLTSTAVSVSGSATIEGEVTTSS